MADEVKTLADLLTKQWGVKTRALFNNGPNSIAGLTPVQIARNDPSRLGLTIMNLSANNVWVVFDPSPSSTRGLLLQANGGGLTLRWDEHFDMVTQEWWAVAAVAGSQLAISEVGIFGT